MGNIRRNAMLITLGKNAQYTPPDSTRQQLDSIAVTGSMHEVKWNIYLTQLTTRSAGVVSGQSFGSSASALLASPLTKRVRESSGIY